MWDILFKTYSDEYVVKEYSCFNETSIFPRMPLNLIDKPYELPTSNRQYSLYRSNLYMLQDMRQSSDTTATINSNNNNNNNNTNTLDAEERFYDAPKNCAVINAANPIGKSLILNLLHRGTEQLLAIVTEKEEEYILKKY